MASQITTQNGDTPIPQPKPQSRSSRGSQRKLAAIANKQVEAAIGQARALVADAAAIEVEIFAAVPHLVHAEAATLLDARMPLIQADSDALIAESAAIGRAAAAESRGQLDEFLSKYGLGG
jgi:hypothetical protein